MCEHFVQDSDFVLLSAERFVNRPDQMYTVQQSCAFFPPSAFCTMPTIKVHNIVVLMQ